MKREYPLRPPGWGLMIGGLLLFGAGGVFEIWHGATTQRELIINGIIHLDVHDASIFHVVLGCISLCIAAAAVVARVRLRGARLRVVVEDERIVVPTPLGRSAHEVAYEHVTDIKLMTVKDHDFVKIFYRGGHCAIGRTIVGDEAFEEIVAGLASKVPQTRSSLPVAPARAERPMRDPRPGPPPAVDAGPFRGGAPVVTSVVVPDGVEPAAVVEDPAAPPPKLLK
jgi:hypothetical protein